jgi:hypothetical protein
MKRVKIVGMLVAGLVVIVAMLMLAAASQPARAASHAAPLAQTAVRYASVLAPTAGVTCTLSTTTTEFQPGNQSFATAVILSNASFLSLVPTTYVAPGAPPVDVATQDDYYFMNANVGNIVSVSAIPENSASGNYNLGLDVYDQAYRLLQSDTDTTDFSASITIVPTYTGQMYFRVYQLNTAGRCTGGYYSLLFTNKTPTPTPSLTSTPTRTPSPTKTIGPTVTPYAGAPSVDAFEPNNDFDHATTLGLGVKYDNLNFVQWDVNSDEWDNDFFKVRVKPGMLITCHTLDLAPGTDTNLILYDNNRNGINGNDDVNRAAGDLSSSVTYYTTYEGWLYALVGEGFSRPLSEQQKTRYSFECIIGSQSTATPTIEPTLPPGVPTRTPTPTITLTPSPTLSPTPPFIMVVPLPTVTPPGLPLVNIPVSLQVYYDANGNNQPDPGEGVVGVSARVFDLVTGRLLAQQLTDETGRVSFTVSAPGAVQLAVPYLNFSTIILPSGGSAVIRVSGRELPQSIP